MSIDIEAIRARAEEFREAKGYTRAGAAHASALDVPALLDEVERLRSALDNSAVGHGIAVAHAGDWKHRAEMAEAERDRLRAAVDAVKVLAERWDDRFLAAVRSTLPEHEWPNAGIDPRSRELRAALDEHLRED